MLLVRGCKLLTTAVVPMFQLSQILIQSTGFCRQQCSYGMHRFSQTLIHIVFLWLLYIIKRHLGFCRNSSLQAACWFFYKIVTNTSVVSTTDWVVETQYSIASCVIRKTRLCFVSRFSCLFSGRFVVPVRCAGSCFLVGVQPEPAVFVPRAQRGPGEERRRCHRG